MSQLSLICPHCGRGFDVETSRLEHATALPQPQPITTGEAGAGCRHLVFAEALTEQQHQGVWTHNELSYPTVRDHLVMFIHGNGGEPDPEIFPDTVVRLTEDETAEARLVGLYAANPFVVIETLHSQAERDKQ